LSGDGRFVVFQSGASNLVAGDDDGVVDIFVKDMVSGAVTLVAAPGFPPSADPGISADGRFVAFASSSPDLVDNDTNNCSDVFVKDLFAGGLTRISIGDSGLQGNADSFAPQISGNGRYVTFTSIASNLAAGDTRDSSDAFRKDLVTGELTLISTDRAGQPAGRSFAADVASNGWVVMGSVSSNLVVGDTNNQPDVFLYRSGAVTGGSGAELLRGGASADSMDGGAGRDLLLGGLGDDSLTGGAGDDELAGGPGRDVLVGGGGNDRFVLATPDAGPDTVSDFDPSADTLVVFAAEFGGGLVPGAVLLTPPQTTGNLFVASSDPFATTLNSSSAFLYDTDDGRLWFDPDGSGAQAAVLMATLVSAPAITSSDFLFA
jgi:Ca2+-binding RTX toxin-like protein